MQRTWVRVLLTGLTAGMMVLIFCFSTEPAEKSDQTSGKISYAVIKVVYPEYKQYTTERQRTLYDEVQHWVRKSAHYMEYAVLGLLFRLCLESWLGRRKGLIPAGWACGTLYAGTDEIHQLLIDGRSGMVTDVLLDSCGVLTGVLVAAGILSLARKRMKRGNRDG